MTALAVYTGLTWLLGPVVRLYLRRRVAAGKEDPGRIQERFGRPGRARPEGPLVWMHGASVGEALSMLPLMERILETHRDLNVLVTTGTVTSAKLLARRLPDRAFHQYVPVDLPYAVNGFLEHWHPDLVLWAESEFWPNLVTRISDAKIPLILVNGRVSGRSFANWRRLRPLIRRMMRGFTLCLAQAPEDERLLRDLGGNEVRCAGNLKFAVPALPADSEQLSLLGALIGDRPCWLAASTHDGEESMAGRAHAELAKRFPDLLTIIVPRHPNRGDDVALALRDQGLKVARRSLEAVPGTDCEVYLADTMGELGLWYRLAPVVFVGGSMVTHGGQNPIEAAKLDCAILFGPHMTNFKQVAGAMLERDAARLVYDEAALTDAIAGLLADPSARAALEAAAGAYVEEQAHVLDQILRELQPFMAILRPETPGLAPSLSQGRSLGA